MLKKTDIEVLHSDDDQEYLANIVNNFEYPKFKPKILYSSSYCSPYPSRLSFPFLFQTSPLFPSFFKGGVGVVCQIRS